jgi:hypothetical protein
MVKRDGWRRERDRGKRWMEEREGWRRERDRRKREIE